MKQTQQKIKEQQTNSNIEIEQILQLSNIMKRISKRRIEQFNMRKRKDDKQNRFIEKLEEIKRGFQENMKKQKIEEITMQQSYLMEIEQWEKKIKINKNRKIEREEKKQKYDCKEEDQPKDDQCGKDENNRN